MSNDVVKQVLERIDVLAKKLGIAAQQIWGFSVTAKAVEARRDIAKGAALLLIPLIFFAWGIHVYTMKIPHDFHTPSGMFSGTCFTQPANMTTGGTMGGTVICNPDHEKEEQKDDGPTGIGWMLIVSGVVFTIAGLVISAHAVEEVIDGIAATKTAEYDAYQQILYDLKD